MREMATWTDSASSRGGTVMRAAGLGKALAISERGSPQLSMVSMCSVGKKPRAEGGGKLLVWASWRVRWKWQRVARWTAGDWQRRPLVLM
jgi:hypothetical protein